MNKFIFGNQNKILRDYRKKWLNGSDYGIFILNGESGCGKTAFLLDLEENLGQTEGKNNKVKWLSKNYVEEQIVRHIRSSVPYDIPDAGIIFIEFIDDIMASEYSYGLVHELLSVWSEDGCGRKRLIICTFADESKADKFRYDEMPLACSIIHMHPLKVSTSVVKQKAAEMNVKLTESQLWDLSELDTVTEVVSALKCIATM